MEVKALKVGTSDEALQSLGHNYESSVFAHL
jgi:hypothetical protein